MKKQLLHVGCGNDTIDKLHFLPAKDEWEETRMDIDPRVNPDILLSIQDMNTLQGEFDMIYSSHNLEHLYLDEVAEALTQFYRLTGKGGVVVISVPDLTAAVEFAAKEGIHTIAYTVPDSMSVTPYMMLYGLPGEQFMQHKCGFTKGHLCVLVEMAGYKIASVSQDSNFNLVVVGVK